METLIILMSFLSTVSLFADLVGFYRTDEKICENWKKKRVFICRFVTLALFIFILMKHWRLFSILLSVSSNFFFSVEGELTVRQVPLEGGGR